MALQFFTTCAAYAFISGCIHSRKHTAFAATMFSSGPPCMPGNTAESSALAHFSLQSTSPPRGPRSVLCVVEVTKSA